MAKSFELSDEQKVKMAKAGDKLLHSDSLLYTYLRSIVTSQAAGWFDMFIGFALFAWGGLTPFQSTALGAFSGGVLNCILNYKFTFRADNCDWRAVMVKYALVWIGSMLLNSYGTQVVYYLISGWDWLLSWGFTDKGIYAAARVFMSLMVSWFWNFVLQRYFVYRPTPVDKYFVKMLYLLGIRLKSDKK